MSEFFIRKIKASDAAAIADAIAGAISGILRDLGWFDHIRDEPPEETIEYVRARITQCNADDSHSVFAAESGDGEVAGYAAVHWLPYLFMPGPEGYVSELFVAESHRGKGIGKALMKAVEREAREKGCHRLMLINSRHRQSYERGFYRKQGWIEREKIANFILPMKK